MRDRPAAWMVAIAALAPACGFRGPDAVPRDARPEDATDASDAEVPPDVMPRTWFDNAWTRRRRITIKHTELTGPVQSFPLLVRLPAAVLTTGNANGDDLRFVAGDHTTLRPYQIDTVDGAGALVWVRIPALDKAGAAPELWVYYRNPAASAASNGAAVFGDQYESVHHLGATFVDATGQGHTGTTGGGGTTPLPTAGQIGDARDFDGQNDYLDLAGNEADFDFTTQLSVSAWIRVENLGPEFQAIVTKGDSSWRIHRHAQTQFIGFGTNTPPPGSMSQNTFGDIEIGDGNWHHVAIVFGASTKRVYVDGAIDQSDAVANNTINTNNRAVSIGRNTESTTGGERIWDGDLDEVRISATARDNHWMFAEHHTVADADFVTVGAEESGPP